MHLGQNQGAGVFTGLGLRLRQWAHKKRLPFTAVLGRNCFPLLGKFFAIETSTSESAHSNAIHLFSADWNCSRYGYEAPKSTHKRIVVWTQFLSACCTSDTQFAKNKTLKKMGINTAFDRNQADNSGMAGSKHLDISEVLHKAPVDVNREGAEAAAATSAGSL
jgi:hypothetical protein